MAKAPTYQDFNRQRAEADAIQSQANQRTAVAQNTEAAVSANINPVLAEYMQRNSGQQGLVPRDTGMTYDYSTIASSIAKNVPDQESYSLAMIDAAMKGYVPAEAVLGDTNVLDQAKVGLVNAMKQSQNQGLGQVAQY